MQLIPTKTFTYVSIFLRTSYGRAMRIGTRAGWIPIFLPMRKSALPNYHSPFAERFRNAPVLPSRSSSARTVATLITGGGGCGNCAGFARWAARWRGREFCIGNSSGRCAAVRTRARVNYYSPLHARAGRGWPLEEGGGGGGGGGGGERGEPSAVARPPRAAPDLPREKIRPTAFHPLPPPAVPTWFESPSSLSDHPLRSPRVRERLDEVSGRCRL